MGFGKARTWLDMAEPLFAALDLPVNINWLEIPDDIKNQYQYFTEANMKKWIEAEMSPAKWSLEDSIYDYVKNHLSQNDPWL